MDTARQNKSHNSWEMELNYGAQLPALDILFDKNDPALSAYFCDDLTRNDDFIKNEVRTYFLDFAKNILRKEFLIFSSWICPHRLSRLLTILLID